MTIEEQINKNYHVSLSVSNFNIIKSITGKANSDEVLQVALLEYIELKEAKKK